MQWLSGRYHVLVQRHCYVTMLVLRRFANERILEMDNFRGMEIFWVVGTFGASVPACSMTPTGLLWPGEEEKKSVSVKPLYVGDVFISTAGLSALTYSSSALYRQTPRASPSRAQVSILPFPLPAAYHHRLYRAF